MTATRCRVAVLASLAAAALAGSDADPVLVRFGRRDGGRRVRMRGGRVVPVVAVGAVLVAGCATAPEVVAGSPAPLTPVPTTAAAPTRSSTPPARPTATPTATRPGPVLPTEYETLQLAAQGVTVRLPVPAEWTRTRTQRGYDFGDPSQTLLLRIEVTGREGAQTARQHFESLEPDTAGRLVNYERLDAVDLPDGALDWSFTFDGNGGRRRAIDRLLVSGPAAVAVYFSAVERDFDRLLPIWTKAKDGLTIS
jgi:hypothetical protein